MATSKIPKPTGIKIVSVTGANIQINGGDKAYGSINVTPPSGYTAMSIAGFDSSGDYATYLVPLRLSIASGKVSWGVRNVATSGTSNATLTVQVLCVKQ